MFIGLVTSILPIPDMSVFVRYASLASAAHEYYLVLARDNFP